VWSAAAESRVRTNGVVIADPAAEPVTEFGAGLERVQVDAFVFHRSPEPLDEDIVEPAAATVHRDAHAGVLQQLDKARTGELRSLICVEDLGRAVPCQGLLDCGVVEIGMYGVRKTTIYDIYA